MTVFGDIKNVSENALEQLTAKFGDLPRPLLAAIGAGDLAVEQLVKLRDQVGERLGSSGSAPSREEIKAFAGDLPGRAQKAANDVAQHLQQFASTAPDKAQKLIGELPAKAQELSNSLTPENFRATLDSYTRMVGTIYGSLADRGGDAVAKSRPAGDDDSATSAGSKTAGSKGTGSKSAGAKAAGSKAAGSKAAGSKAATKPATKKPAATKTATKKPAATKTAAKKPATKKPAAKKPAAAPSAATSTGPDSAGPTRTAE